MLPVAKLGFIYIYIYIYMVNFSAPGTQVVSCSGTGGGLCVLLGPRTPGTPGTPGTPRMPGTPRRDARDAGDARKTKKRRGTGDA